MLRYRRAVHIHESTVRQRAVRGPHLDLKSAELYTTPGHCSLHAAWNATFRHQRSSGHEDHVSDCAEERMLLRSCKYIMHPLASPARHFTLRRI